MNILIIKTQQPKGKNQFLQNNVTQIIDYLIKLTMKGLKKSSDLLETSYPDTIHNFVVWH